MATTDAAPQPELITVEPVTTAVVRGSISFADIRDYFDRSFTALGEVMGAQGVAATGPAFGLYHGIPAETIDLEVGFPADRAIEAHGAVEAGELPGGRIARLVHAGPFDGLATTWQQLGSWIAEQGLTPSETFWEVYVTEPEPDMDPATLRTELNWLLA